jgi:hypothetical protein
MDQDEPLVTRRFEYAQVGETMMVDGRCGWVKRLIGTPVPVDKHVMTSIRAYVVTTSRGDVTLDTAAVRYDTVRRLWVGRTSTPA